jgi:anti-sigma B factor antagonist
MTLKMRTVTVTQFPQTSNADERRNFLHDVGLSLTVDRPCLVLDCSGRIELDRPALLLLLTCLEEAMKRNGDVRLAGVSRQARAILETSGVIRLFKIFDSIAEAEGSFRRSPSELAPVDSVHRGTRRDSGHRAAESNTSENAA